MNSIIILEDSDDGEETERAVRMALAELKERLYPGYLDRNHPDHEVEHGHIVVSMEYFLTHRRTLNDPMSQASRQGRIFTPVVLAARCWSLGSCAKLVVKVSAIRNCMTELLLALPALLLSNRLLVESAESRLRFRFRKASHTVQPFAFR